MEDFWTSCMHKAKECQTKYPLIIKPRRTLPTFQREESWDEFSSGPIINSAILETVGTEPIPIPLPFSQAEGERAMSEIWSDPSYGATVLDDPLATSSHLPPPLIALSTTDSQTLIDPLIEL
jgi:hypothetical protein